jgi:hypothetical protein
MNPLFIALFLAATCACFGDPVQRAPYHAAEFPTKPGEYFHKQWKYVYIIKNQGTRSEQRIGELFLEGKKVTGTKGELLQEHLGFFMYFGEIGYNQGWLNTMTYDQPVFEGKQFELTPEAKLITNSFAKKKKTEQDAAANP